MNAVAAALAKCADWDQPRSVAGNPFRLICRLSPGARHEEITAAWGGIQLVRELRELWMTAREAELFVDADFGQWGLRLLSPSASASRSASERDARPGDLVSSDVVVGVFVGDQDLLVVDAAGAVMVAMQLDERSDWYRPAPDLAKFLERYVTAAGAKYWETEGGRQ